MLRRRRGRIATSRRRSSASRSRASASACTASTRWRVWLEPHLDLPGIDAPLVGARRSPASLAIGVLTFVHIVIGEMVPKSLALQHPRRIGRVDGTGRCASRSSCSIRSSWCSTCTARTAACGSSASGGRQHAHEQFYTPEELQLIVEESAARRRAARRVRAGSCASCSSSAICTAGAGDGAARARRRHSGRRDARRRSARIVAEHRHTRYAVYDGDLDHIVGMLHVKDLLRRLLAERAGRAARRAARCRSCPRPASLDDVLATMQRSHAHLAVVIDEHGGTAGIVSLEDLFEEVVGEIDEGVPAAPPLVPAPDGSVTRRRHGPARRARPVLRSRSRARRRRQRQRPRARAARPAAGRRRRRRLRPDPPRSHRDLRSRGEDRSRRLASEAARGLSPDSQTRSHTVRCWNWRSCVS